MGNLDQPVSRVHAPIPRPLHEQTDVEVKPLVYAGAGVVVTTILAGIIVWLGLLWAFHLRLNASAQPQPSARGGRVIPPEPRLQATPRADFGQYKARQSQLLNSYGWVDRETGVVRIPITEAMRLIEERGIPPQEAPAELNLFTPEAGTRQTGFETRRLEDRR